MRLGLLMSALQRELMRWQTRAREQFVEIACLLTLAKAFRESAGAVNLSAAQRQEMSRKAEILQRIADRLGR